MGSISRRKFLQFAAMATGSGILAACTPAPQASPTSAPAAPAGGAPAAQPTAAPAAAAKPAGAAGTLTFVWDSDADKLDPPTMNTQQGFILCSSIHEGLVRYKPNSTDIEPLLAESYNVSPDGLTYTFKLRQGVKFHDGSDLTAEAVVFNFDRGMNKDNPLYKDAQAQGGFPYFGDYIGDVISSVKATGPLEVTFVLKRKYSPFTSNLAIAAITIQSMEALKKLSTKIGDTPVGTGPFKFKEWVKNDHVTLVPNENYWGTKPKLQQMVFQVVPEASVRVLKIKSGEADIAWPIDPKDVASIKGQADTDVIEAAGLNFNYISFNLLKPQFQNKALRQAMNYAVNKEELANVFYSGAGVPATGVLPPSSWAYDSTLKAYPFDMQKAKSLLKDSGYNGDTIEFDAYTVARGYNPQGAKLAEALQQYWSDLGVKTQIKTWEWADFRKQRNQGNMFLSMGGWMADTGDPDNIMVTHFRTAPPGGVNNFNYSNPEADKFMDQADSETDLEKRKTAFHQAERIIVDDAPAVFIGSMKQQVAVRKRVKGVAVQPNYVFYFNDATVS